jgi:hypothetical protein
MQQEATTGGNENLAQNHYKIFPPGQSKKERIRARPKPRLQPRLLPPHLIHHRQPKRHKAQNTGQRRTQEPRAGDLNRLTDRAQAAETATLDVTTNSSNSSKTPNPDRQADRYNPPSTVGSRSTTMKELVKARKYGADRKHLQ